MALHAALCPTTAGHSPCPRSVPQPRRAHRHIVSYLFPLLISLSFAFFFIPPLAFCLAPGYSSAKLSPRPSLNIHTHVGWGSREGDSAPTAPLAGKEVHVFHPSLSPCVLCVWKILTHLLSSGFSHWLSSLWVGHFCVSIAKSSL